MTHDLDAIEFDDLLTLALAYSAADGGTAPRAGLKQELLARVVDPPVPEGFSFRLAKDADWLPHPVPGIKMKVLAMNRASGYATLLLDVAPGTRFPPHYHTTAEECYVISGSLYTCDRRMDAGDFLHADANTDHGELWTEEGCRVLLVATPEDYMPDPAHN
jgi:anti-sigma factor ChrR (cupin superfamily)